MAASVITFDFYGTLVQWHETGGDVDDVAWRHAQHGSTAVHRSDDRRRSGTASIKCDHDHP
jgi:FMN phosphatase YigB (HAD superfamily)